MIFLSFIPFKMCATSRKCIDRVLLQSVVIYTLFKLYGSTKDALARRQGNRKIGRRIMSQSMLCWITKDERFFPHLLFCHLLHGTSPLCCSIEHLHFPLSSSNPIFFLTVLKSPFFLRPTRNCLKSIIRIRL